MKNSFIYARLVLIILLLAMNDSFSFSNLSEKTLGADIIGFIRILDKESTYSIVMDKSIYDREIETDKGKVIFKDIAIIQLNQLIIDCKLPIAITVATQSVVADSTFNKENKFIIYGNNQLPNNTLMSTFSDFCEKKYRTQNKAELKVYYNNLNNKKFTQDKIARLLLHEILHFFSLGHCYYDMIEDKGAGKPTSIASIDRVMWFSDAGAEKYTIDEEMGLQTMYNPIQFKHEIRGENQNDYFEHDTKILFNKYIKEGDYIVKSPFLDYTLRLQGNSNIPNACFKMMKEREKLDVLYKDDPFYEANFNYNDGILGAPNTIIDKFQFSLSEKVMDVRFPLDEIELDNKGTFKLRMYHEYNEDYIHAYPMIQNHTTGITPRNYENRSYTFSENADDYIDFQVADFKISEPMSNSRLESDEFNIKVQPYSEEQKKYLDWGYIDTGIFNPFYQGVKEVWYSITRYYFNEANELIEDGGYIISSDNIENNFNVTIKDNMITKNSKQIIIDKESTYCIEAFCFDEYRIEVGKTMISFNMKIKADNKKGVTPYDGINIFVESMKDAQLDDDKKSIYWLELKWAHGDIEKDLALNENIKGYKGSEFILKLEGVGKELEILRWSYNNLGYELLDFTKLIDGEQLNKPKISQAVWDEVSANYKSEKYKFKLYLTLEKDNGLKGEKILYPVTEYEFNLTRPITLGTISMVFKKPATGTKNVYGNIAALQEKDTLRVTVPKYATEAEYWGGTEILLDGQVSSYITVPALPEPPFREYGDSIRVYKFVWDFSQQPEGFVTMRARYKDDPLSYDQKKIKVGYSKVWEDFENASNGEIPSGWETKTQYAYPLGLGEEGHYWRTTYNTSTKSNELRTSTYGFSSQRFEILGPLITVPQKSEDVETFLYFDYAREYGEEFVTGGKSLMVMQFCDENGTPLPFEWQPFGSISQNDDYPVTGYPLNQQNFFSPNYVNVDLFPDNLWLNMGFGLSMSDKDYGGMKIRVKFIQFYTVDFVGVIDNWDWSSGTPVWTPTPIVFHPPAYTDAVTHHIDNFRVVTYYMINLPPTIDKVADQEVKQHCGWQRINLTGITHGQNATVGDNEDLEDQKSKLSKFLPQQVVEITLYSDNRVVIPADSLKLELAYTPGDTTAVLMYKPEDIESGSSNITVTVRDDGGIEHNGRDYTEMKFKINVLPFNPPKYDPPMTELESITEDFERFTINLGSHFTDPDGDKINYKYSADSSLVKIERNGDVLTAKSVPDAFGQGSFTIVADDSTGTIPTIVTVPINIANDFDDFEFIEYEIVDEDSIAKMFLPTNFEAQSMNIDEKFKCELTGVRTYTVTLSNTETLNAGTSGNSLTLTPKTDVKGIVDATLGVSVNGRTITDKLRIIVGNLPPEIKAEIADIETPANFKTMYINLKDHYTDPNKDWLGYSVRTTQFKIDTYISFYDDQLIIESKANESGVDSLYISIYDGEFTVRDSLKITIGTPTTQVPYLATPIEDQHVKEDFGTKTVDLSEHFADPAGTGIAYIVDFDSTKVKCTIEEGHLLVMKSVKDFHGYVPIHVSIDDGVQKIKDPNFKDCDPKNVVRISEKIKKALTKLN